MSNNLFTAIFATALSLASATSFATPQILKYAIKHCLPTRRQKKEEHVTGVIQDWVWSRLMLPAACPPPARPPMTLRDLLFLPGSPQPAHIDIQ